MKLKHIKKQGMLYLLLLNMCLLNSAFGDNKRRHAYYRYVNDQGIKVMNQTIPARFAKNGYEIVTRTGHVIEVVPPAPKPEEIEAARQKEFLKTKYLALIKRYSATEDINAARERKLDQINANIAIQKGNLTNINGQVDKLTERAANYERSNRPVPVKILGHLDELKSQYAEVEEQIERRREEVRKTNLKFDADVVLFEKGKTLLDRSSKIDEQLVQAGLLKEFTQQ